MKSIRWVALLLVASVFLTGCGFFRSLVGGKDKSDSDDQAEAEYPNGNAAGLTVPDYKSISSGADTPDLSSISATVQTWQTRGQLIA